MVGIAALMENSSRRIEMIGSTARYPSPQRQQYGTLLVLIAASLLLVPMLQGLVTMGSLPHASTPASMIAPPDASTSAKLETAYGALPLSFEENQGQADSDVRFVSRGAGYTLLLTPTEAVLALSKPAPRGDKTHEKQSDKGTVLRMGLVGANPNPQLAGIDALPGKVNYLIGSDPSKWHTDVPTYAKVRYTAVYPGIDMVYYGNQGQLEYDFVVAPGADPKPILLRYEGADSIEVGRKGDLVLGVSGGQVRLHKPIVYQVADSETQEIASRYRLKGDGRVSFELGTYDHTRPLIIDPVLS
jgi:hypothetical protein